MSLSETLKSIFELDGSASGSARTAKPAPVEDPWLCEAQVSSGTSATGTDETSTRAEHPSSTTSVMSTPSHGSAPTDWTEALSGLRDDPLLLDLGAENYRKILMIAEGACETPQTILEQIREFFVSQEDERSEYPLRDQVQFYLDNYWME